MTEYREKLKSNWYAQESRDAIEVGLLENFGT